MGFGFGFAAFPLRPSRPDDRYKQIRSLLWWCPRSWTFFLFVFWLRRYDRHDAFLYSLLSLVWCWCHRVSNVMLVTEHTTTGAQFPLWNQAERWVLWNMLGLLNFLYCIMRFSILPATYHHRAIARVSRRIQPFGAATSHRPVDAKLVEWASYGSVLEAKDIPESAFVRSTITVRPGWTKRKERTPASDFIDFIIELLTLTWLCLEENSWFAQSYKRLRIEHHFWF